MEIRRLLSGVSAAIEGQGVKLTWDQVPANAISVQIDSDRPSVTLAAAERSYFDLLPVPGYDWYRVTAQLDDSSLVTIGSTAIVAPAWNDNFADRLPLSGQDIAITWSNEGATSEPNEPASESGSAAGGTVWWSWIAPATGELKITSIQEAFLKTVNPQVFVGDSVGDLLRDPVADNYGYTNTFNVTQGVEYEIRANDAPTFAARFEWQLQFTPESAAPAAPTGLSYELTDGGLQFHWTDNSDNELQYVMERARWDYAYESIGTLDADTTSDAVPVSWGQALYYRVRAVGKGLDSFSDPVLVEAPPLQPTDVTVQAVQGHATITWNSPENTYVFQTFEISRKGLSGEWEGVRTCEGSVRTYTDQSTEAGDIYEYRIRAQANDMTSDWVLATGDFSTPPAKPHVQVSGDTSGVHLSWDAIANATSYRVARSSSFELADAVELGNTSAIGFDDVPPVAGEFYWYGVYASGPAGEGQSATAMAYMEPSDGTAHIRGTDQADVIRVRNYRVLDNPPIIAASSQVNSTSGGTIIIINPPPRGTDTLLVQVNGQSMYFAVGAIHIEAGDGNDDVRIDDGVGVRCGIDGGAGDDYLAGPKYASGYTVISGGEGNDTITGGFDGRSDSLDGGAGDDLLIGLTGADTLQGGDGNDTIFGGPGDDSIAGGNGDDSLLAGLGNDTVDGGAGNDWISGEGGDDRLSGGEGNDWIAGMDGADTINGDGGNDTVFGGPGADSIMLGDGNDLCWSGRENDSVWGGAGRDIIVGDNGDDWIAGETGFDVLNGGSENDSIYGGPGCDLLIGVGGDDVLHGGADADKLYGGYDDDAMFGEGGNDTLWGGLGNDTLDGGAGSDGVLGEGGGDSLDSSGDGAADIVRGDGGSDHLRRDLLDTVLDVIEDNVLTQI